MQKSSTLAGSAHQCKLPSQCNFVVKGYSLHFVKTLSNDTDSLRQLPFVVLDTVLILNARLRTPIAVLTKVDAGRNDDSECVFSTCVS